MQNGRPSENKNSQSTQYTHDFNNHLIFTVVDEKKLNGFTLTAPLDTAVFAKISHAVYRLHNATAYQMSLRYTYRGENEGLAAALFT